MNMMTRPPVAPPHLREPRHLVAEELQIDAEDEGKGRRVRDVLARIDRYDVLIALGMACSFASAMVAWSIVP